MRANLRDLNQSVLRVRLWSAAAALAFLGCVALAVWNRSFPEADFRGHRATLDLLGATSAAFQSAVANGRGFLLRADGSDYEAFQDESSRTRRFLDELETSAPEGGLPVGQIAELRRTIEEQLSALGSFVDLARAGRSEAAIRLFQDDSVSGIGEVQSLVNRLIRLTHDSRELVRFNAERDAWERTVMILGTALVAFGFLALAIRSAVRELSLQYVASLEAERQREILSVTLASIGDAVLITDTAGRVTFVNRVTEQLSGWSLAEAVDQPASDVFPIVDEENRDVRSDPVQLVLRTGEATQVSSDSLLRTRSGEFLAVDHSAAPIREADGTIRGVVLVFRDSSTRRETEQNLLSSKRKLEEAAKAKDRFLAMLSHELRTPLTPVLATLSDWELHGRLPAERQRELLMVRNNVAVQARLIDDLLDISRIVHGKLELSPVTVDVNPLLEATRELFADACRSRGISLFLDARASESHVKADPARLRQILWNITGNALKFCTRGDRIDLASGNPQSGRLRVTVSDTGAGMSQSTRERIFEPFMRGGDGASADGLGLGLPIARALVEAQGGTLFAESEGLGRGARFTMEFPTVARGEPVRPPIPSPAGALRILLVEDHPDTADVLASLLGKFGHDVRPCRSIAEANRAAMESEFDLVICDVGLPDGTGIEFLRTFRKTSTAPAVALTGYGSPADIERCMAAGFAAHLTKPIDIGRLDAVIRQVDKTAGFRLPSTH